MTLKKFLNSKEKKAIIIEKIEKNITEEKGITERNIDLPDGFEYIEHFISFTDSIDLFNKLVKEIDFEEREIVMFGKKMMQPRLIKWYGDKEYTYSKQTFEAQKMPQMIQKLKRKIENTFHLELNSVLINYYRNEQDSMGKHSDDERELGNTPIICSISLGEEREFVIINKDTKERIKISLQSGSLLVMSGDSQRDFWHELPKSKYPKKGRINLTFRFIY